MQSGVQERASISQNTFVRVSRSFWRTLRHGQDDDDGKIRALLPAEMCPRKLPPLCLIFSPLTFAFFRLACSLICLPSPSPFTALPHSFTLSPCLRSSCVDPLTFADVPLLYQAPEHVRAAMAVRRFVKRLLTEAVPMAGWSLGRDRRHIPRSTAEPLTPDFHCEDLLHRSRRATMTTT